MTVAELGQRMSSSELTEWQARFNEDPWHRERQDFMLAQVAFHLFNSWRGKEEAFRAIDKFMPFVKVPPREQPVDEQILRLKAALPPKKK